MSTNLFFNLVYYGGHFMHFCCVTVLYRASIADTDVLYGIELLVNVDLACNHQRCFDYPHYVLLF